MTSNEREVIVLKVGAHMLLGGIAGVRLRNVSSLVELVADLRKAGKDVVLVSAGAVGMGLKRLEMQEAKSLSELQVAAAVGQTALMTVYQDQFNAVGLHCAQLLLEQRDFADEDTRSNATRMLRKSLEMGVVPIINNNDITSIEGLRADDNDNVASSTAELLAARWLFIFTDVDYLSVDGKALRVVHEPRSLKLDGIAQSDGMAANIVAARMASTAGISCGLIKGSAVDRVHSFLRFDTEGDGSLPEGTLFKALDVAKVEDNRRWILSLPVAGTLVLNDDAARGIANHKSLLHAGILGVEGSFLKFEAVRLTYGCAEIGRALANFSAKDLAQISGRHSEEFEEILGDPVRAEACDRSNIILTH